MEENQKCKTVTFKEYEGHLHTDAKRQPCFTLAAQHGRTKSMQSENTVQVMDETVYGRYVHFTVNLVQLRDTSNVSFLSSAEERGASRKCL